jgi:hypothetical protein
MCILCGPPAADMPDRTARHERGSARPSPPSAALPSATDRRWSRCRSSRGRPSAGPCWPRPAPITHCYSHWPSTSSKAWETARLSPAWRSSRGSGLRPGRLRPRMAPLTPGAGWLPLAAAYSAISVMLFSGHHVQALLIVLLCVGGLGLGIQFSALIKHLTTAVPAEYAADISGVSTTAQRVGSCRRSAVVDLPASTVKHFRSSARSSSLKETFQRARQDSNPRPAA